MRERIANAFRRVAGAVRNGINRVRGRGTRSTSGS